MNIFYAVLALGALSGAFGLLLAVASKVFQKPSTFSLAKWDKI